MNEPYNKCNIYTHTRWICVYMRAHRRNIKTPNETRLFEKKFLSLLSRTFSISRANIKLRVFIEYITNFAHRFIQEDTGVVSISSLLCKREVLLEFFFTLESIHIAAKPNTFSHDIKKGFSALTSLHFSSRPNCLSNTFMPFIWRRKYIDFS